MEKKPSKIVSLDELIDKYIGKRGTPEREKFEYELRLDLLGEAIKQARKERKTPCNSLYIYDGYRSVCKHSAPHWRLCRWKVTQHGKRFLLCLTIPDNS